MVAMIDDEFFMQQAMKEARKAHEKGEVPIGAVVVMNEQVIGRGYNQVEMLERLYRACRNDRANSCVQFSRQ